MIRKTLIEKFRAATLAAYPELQNEPAFPMEITESTQEKFGHYQFNSAMKLAKILKATPRQIAENILTEISQKGCPVIEKMEIAGPGFINITLSPVFISRSVDKMLRTPWSELFASLKKQRIVIDFSSPNTAKEMHVGHLRSTIIGDCLARLFEFLGHDVLRLNHVGDWGTAFGMLIAHMKEKAPKALTGEEETDLTHLVSWYKEAKHRFDQDPVFKKTAQLEVVALQGGSPESLSAWEIICGTSRNAYQEIYTLLDISLIERGESFYNSMLPNIVKDLEQKGLVTVSDGAKCIFLEGFYNRDQEPLPLMIQKSDGGYNYDTTDMATIYQRIHDEHADRLVYVTDAGQQLHFQLIFKAAEKAGYLNREKTKVDHVTFGLVLGPDGKKFRTRSGDTERLIDLLTAAIDYADKILVERSPELDLNERKNLALALGVGAIKYADLSCHRTGDYVFSYERMLRFEGNTAAYLMYSYVRIAGIKRKIDVDIKAIRQSDHILLEHPSEVALGLHLLCFTETLEQLEIDLLPHRLTDYLYTLAEKFNAFFRDCRVEGSPQQNSRLLLCDVVASVMKQGLYILGVKTVEKM